MSAVVAEDLAGAASLRLRCTSCGAEVPFAPLTSGCPACRNAGRHGALEVAYDYAARLGERSPADLVLGARRFWDFARLLPVDDVGSQLDLGQGFTPVVPIAGDGPQVHLKLEGANPTWSFKDRYCATSVGIAKAFGYRRVVASSTGNLGASVAAYAAKAKLEAVILCPPAVSDTLLAQISAYGGTPIVMGWEERTRAMQELAATSDVFPVGLFIAWPVSNPFGVEGYKTIAYELFRALGSKIDAVVFPCARGNGLFGTWKGFCELRDLNLIESIPRMIGVQPQGAASLPAAFAAGTTEPAEIESPHSVATSIQERVASADALRAIYLSGGLAVAVSDEEIMSATRLLGAEGLCVELASGAAYAATRQLAAKGVLKPGEIVACILTSAGIKWPSDLVELRRRPVQHAESVADAVSIALGKAHVGS